MTRLFLGLQPPGSPPKLQGAYTWLEYSIGGQACHLNRGYSPLLVSIGNFFFHFPGNFFEEREREIWTHVKNCERNCFLTIFLKFSIKKYFCCDIFQSHFENIYCIKRLTIKVVLWIFFHLCKISIVTLNST